MITVVGQGFEIEVNSSNGDPKVWKIDSGDRALIKHISNIARFDLVNCTVEIIDGRTVEYGLLGHWLFSRGSLVYVKTGCGNGNS